MSIASTPSALGRPGMAFLWIFLGTPLCGLPSLLLWDGGGDFVVGDGSDTMAGRFGNDLLHGSRGADLLVGGQGGGEFHVDSIAYSGPKARDRIVLDEDGAIALAIALWESASPPATASTSETST